MQLKVIYFFDESDGEMTAFSFLKNIIFQSVRDRGQKGALTQTSFIEETDIAFSHKFVYHTVFFLKKKM